MLIATTLDPATVMVLSILMGSAMSAVLYSVSRSFPAEIKGLQHWATGLALLAVSALLIQTHAASPLPQWLSVLLINTCLLGGVSLPLLGTWRFIGCAVHWRWFLFIWLIETCGMAWLMLWQHSQALATAWFSLFAAICHGQQWRLVLRYGSAHRSTWLFGMLLLIATVVALSRGVVALNGVAGRFELLLPGPTQSLYLAMGNFMVPMLAMGFLNMATHRLQTVLERQAMLDPLTQVLNRRGFALAYARVLAGLRRRPRYLTLLSIDIDFFKSINDRHGHSVGDRVLVDVAQVIGAALRAEDYVARFGGEEFVVLLTDTDPGAGSRVAERIQCKLRTRHAGPGQDGLPAYTISIGIACHAHWQESMEELMLRADRALYRAKQLGRDRFEMATCPPACSAPAELTPDCNVACETLQSTPGDSGSGAMRKDPLPIALD